MGPGFRRSPRSTSSDRSTCSRRSSSSRQAWSHPSRLKSQTFGVITIKRAKGAGLMCHLYVEAGASWYLTWLLPSLCRWVRRVYCTALQAVSQAARDRYFVWQMRLLFLIAFAPCLRAQPAGASVEPSTPSRHPMKPFVVYERGVATVYRQVDTSPLPCNLVYIKVIKCASSTTGECAAGRGLCSTCPVPWHRCPRAEFRVYSSLHTANRPG